MKKLAFFSVLTVLLLITQPALANSMPLVYDDEGPHYSMGIFEDCAIGIDREALGFDIHFEGRSPVFMDVSARYDMRNHAQTQDVLMAFPLLFTLQNTDALIDAHVQADGVTVASRHLFVSSVQHLSSLEPQVTDTDTSRKEAYLENLEIETLISYLNSTDDPLENTSPSQYRMNSHLDIYALQGAGEVEYLDIHWPWDMDKQPILYGDAINSVRDSRNQDTAAYSTRIWLQDGRIDAFIALPSGFDVKRAQVEIHQKDQEETSGNNDADYKNPSKASIGFDHRQRITMEQFLRNVCIPRLIARYPQAAALQNEAELYRCMLGELQYSNFPSLDRVLTNIGERDMIGLLLYEIPFEAGQIRQVEVSYQQTPQYFSHFDMHAYFTYISSPARHYRDFGTLDIFVRFINPPKRTQTHVGSSSVQFKKVAKDTYFASMDGLPQGELTFGVSCAQPQKSALPIIFCILFFIILLPRILLIGGVLLLVYLVIRHIKKKKSANA